MSYTGTNTTHASFNWNPDYDSYLHVATWGNDTLGDGTKKHPLRTIERACALGTATANYYIVLGTGTYREIITTNYSSILKFQADGQVIIDVTNGRLFDSGTMNPEFVGIYFRGSGSSIIMQSPSPTSCVLDGVIASTGFFTNIKKTVFKNITGLLQLYVATPPYTLTDNTFYNCSQLQITVASFEQTQCTRNIFKNCNINIITSATGAINCSCFHNCNFKFNSIGTYTSYNNFTNFSSALNAALGSATTNVFNLYFTDPLFNNITIGDLSLSLNSPAKNMAPDGTPIGASKAIGVSLVGSVNPSASAFDNDSAININIDNLSGAISVADTAQNSQVTTRPIANLAGRNIANLSTFGFYSDRNGEYIDATPDLDHTGTYAAGETLTTDRVYLVDGSGGQIIYNGNTLAVGDRFTCKSAANTFTNLSVNGFVREIIEGPTRNNIEARFSNGTGIFKNNADTLTTGYWYYLGTGTAALSGVNYTAGQFIKGDGTAVTTTAAIIEEVFTTDAYQYYENFGPLTCNRSGNVFTGTITKGNGDPAFDRTPANVFKIASKYIQIRYTIQADNLTP